jgi:hypothetical protein
MLNKRHYKIIYHNDNKEVFSIRSVYLRLNGCQNRKTSKGFYMTSSTYMLSPHYSASVKPSRLNTSFDKKARLSLFLITFISAMSLSVTTYAEEAKTSKSSSASKNKITSEVGHIKENIAENTPSLTTKVTTTSKQKQADSNVSTTLTIQSDQANFYQANITHEYSIYSANASLIDDVDRDGYFSRFSVTFDADILSYHDELHFASEVYAELYLSKDGGPWIHYYTTDSFIIDGDTTDDEHEVITTLNTGYLSDEYDVLIDLYEVGYEDIIATVSAEDINELYALPLESANNDVIYIEHHGGGLSFISLLFIFIITIKRVVNKAVFTR